MLIPPANRDFEGLIRILKDLREHCPWDRKQTVLTLRQQTIEELYELTDSITAQDWKGMKEELGDLLLHILFYSRIAEEQGAFSLQEVIEGICEKLVSRHPHVYGTLELEGEEAVKRNWEKLKLREGKQSALSGVPGSLPALVKAMRLQEKAKQTGFEWETITQVREKILEEWSELDQAIQAGGDPQITSEFGDLFFSMVNYSRFLRVDADHALELTNLKFIRRFTRMEQLAASAGKTLSEMTLEEMDQLWEQVKAGEN